MCTRLLSPGFTGCSNHKDGKCIIIKLYKSGRQGSSRVRGHLLRVPRCGSCQRLGEDCVGTKEVPFGSDQKGSGAGRAIKFFLMLSRMGVLTQGGELKWSWAADKDVVFSDVC